MYIYIYIYYINVKSSQGLGERDCPGHLHHRGARAYARGLRWGGVARTAMGHRRRHGQKYSKNIAKIYINNSY